MVTERRTTKRQVRSPPAGSGEEDLSEVSSYKSRHSRKVATSKSDARQRARSGTNSSTQTSTPATIKHENSKQKPPQRISTTKGVDAPEKQITTPTHTSFLDVSGDEPQSCQRLDASANTSPLVQRSTQSSITEDSDTDFQSAYSISPRNEHAVLDNGEEQVAMVAAVKGDNLEDRLSAPPRTRKEKVLGMGTPDELTASRAPMHSGTAIFASHSAPTPAR